MMVDFKSFFDGARPYFTWKNLAIVASVLAVLFFFCGQASAQECVPGDEPNGPVDGVHSIVVKPGDTATLTWTNPDLDTNCDALTGENALTEVRLFAQLDSPVDTALEPIATYAPDVTSALVLAQGAKRQSLYWALQWCTQYGCSALSNQRFAKFAGPPQAGSLDTVSK